jgi:NitT/TauT family transport system permease protein
VSRSKLKRRVTFTGLRLLILAALVGLWQLAVETGFFDERLIASPSQIVAAVPTVVQGKDFWENVRLTLWQTAVAFLLATVIGLALGVVAAANRAVRKAIVPYVILANSFPTILLYPVFIVVLGLGTPSIVAVAIFLGVMVIALNTMEGLLGVPSVFTTVGRSLNASRLQLFLKVKVPAARALVFAGLRVALLYTFLSVIATQFLLTGQGLGFVIIRYYGFFQIEELYASIALVAAFTLALEFVLSRIERRIAGHF